MKRIAVLPMWDVEKKRICMDMDYLDALEKQNALGFVVPLFNSKESILEIIQSFDAFLFTGGYDIDPKYYHQKITFSEPKVPMRDAFETELLNFLIQSSNKPVLGICRGMQLMNVVLGGSLYQDLSLFISDNAINHRPDKEKTFLAHEVLVDKSSEFFNIVKDSKFFVNSRHHQGIDRLSKNLLAVAHSDDGLIEAVHLPEKKFFYGVQWHPENRKDDPSSERIFRAFIEAIEG